MKTAADANRNAEALFETRSVAEIRQVESRTRREIKEKQEELRQLIGTSYRDLIESADNILLMKKSCQSVCQNIQNIDTGFSSLHKIVSESAPPTPQVQSEKKKRAELYGIGSRVKYLVDTAENIWGCLDEFMFLEAAGRYVRAREVYGVLTERNQDLLEKSFPLLHHQWQLVENFRWQISQKSRDRLLERGLSIDSYTIAIAAASVIDELTPKQAFMLFLETRKSWLRQRLQNTSDDMVATVLCDFVKIIQVTLWQIAELFLEVLGDLPRFYRTVLAVPPGLQLFGGIPNPDAEVQRWKSHREKLESAMAVLPKEFIMESCLTWLKSCAEEIRSSSSLLNGVKSGRELSDVENSIRETLDSEEAFSPGLEWLKSIFGPNIDSPWQCLCQLIMKEHIDLWDLFFEGIFVNKMKNVISSGFTDLSRKVKFEECLTAIVTAPDYEEISAVLQEQTIRNGSFVENTTITGVEHNRGRWDMAFRLKLISDKDWFQFLNSYYGTDVTQIKDTIDEESNIVLKDLTAFLLRYKSSSRMEELCPYMQEQCFRYISNLIALIEENITGLSAALLRAMRIDLPSKGNSKKLKIPVIVKRALFLGRFSFALSMSSASIPLILGSPQLWLVDNKSAIPGKGVPNSRYFMTEVDQSILGYSAREPLSRAFNMKSQSQNATENSKLSDLRRNMRRLCIRAHNIWISWITEALSNTLSNDVLQDESLSTMTPLKGWEDTLLKEDQEGGGQLETRISLPAMPSLYIAAFLFQGCQEIYRIGGHLLDKVIVQLFAWRLLDKVLKIYEELLQLDDFEDRVSEKGLLQVLFDVKFVADVLSGGQDVPFDSPDFENKVNQYTRDSPGSYNRRLASPEQSEGAWRKRVAVLIQSLSLKLDPIDWATYEPYLWENERQGYQRTAVLFGFLVQLNRLYTDIVQKVPTKADSKTLKTHSSTPRFTLLPISTPILSNTSSKLHQSLSEKSIGNNSWNAYSNAGLSSSFDLEDTSSFSVASPLFKSIMNQVGSKFGEGTFRFGSMLSDGQVGRLKDKSAAAMSTFGDMLPAQAAGLLSSLTVGGIKPEN